MRTPVILNLIQDPSLRAWMLKQVQHDVIFTETEQLPAMNLWVRLAWQARRCYRLSQAVSFILTSNGPFFTMGRTIICPFMLDGIPPEYEEPPPQP